MITKKEDLQNAIFKADFENCTVGLRLVPKKDRTLAQIYIRAYGALGNTLSEVYQSCIN